MACLNDEKIQKYIEKDIPGVEQSIIRDHLIVCPKCQLKHKQLSQLENLLADPVYLSPPERIEKNVMKQIYSRIPTYSSIFTLIAASLVFLISWVYLYFDFSNSSFIQALRLTSESTTNWISTIIKIISSVFSSVHAVYRAANKFFALILNVNIGIEIFSLTVLVLTTIVFYGIYHLLFKRSQKQKI